MSIVNQSGRDISSPQSIIIPNNSSNLEVFKEIKDRMYEMYLILTDSAIVKNLTANYTSEGSEILISDQAITITLNSKPLDQEKVIVKNTGTTITVDGNGRNIDGSLTYGVNAQYEIATFIYIKENDEWYII